MHIYSFLWFILALFFLLFELGHPGLFYFLSFSCGAFAAFFAGLCNLTIFDQGMLFFMVSACAAWVLRKWVKSNGVRNHYRSNVHALRGKRGIIVTPAVRGQFAGYVHIEGQVWAYKMLNEELLPAGSMVEVVDVQGAHLIVKAIS